ncbi:MAG: holdfast anchor protein HfaD [Caulobacteraceae bacterium]|nr:holdfast anchor protein HfaD [Caulobacteraceae bacterium]
MARPARILTAGTIAAIATFAAAATSQAQTVVVSDQTQAADVTADQTLNVVDLDDQVTAATTATGNSLSGAVESGSLDLTASQSMQADAAAETTLNADTGTISGQVTLVSEAVGNTGDAGAYGADMTANVVQATGNFAFTARTTVNGPTSHQTGGASVGATAIANSQAFGSSTGAASTLTVSQSSAALTQADVEAYTQYLPGPAVYSAAATSNNVSSSGTDGTMQLINADQTMTGARTQASTFVSAANAWQIQGSTAAVANNIAATNEDGSLEVAADQSNQSYVQADTVVLAWDYGLASAQAVGVGNSSLAGNNGQYVEIDNTQFNSGGVEVSASFQGDSGYDSYASATAIGNATTAYACSECQGTLRANNVQTNTNTVNASSTVTLTGSGRAVVGTSTAVGNSASFWVSSPGG